MDVIGLPPPPPIHRTGDTDPTRPPITADRGWPAACAGSLEQSVKVEQVGGTVSLVREISCGGDVVTRTVAWSAAHGDVELAVDAYEALGARQADLSFWSVAALVYGDEHLSVVIAPVVAKYVQGREEEREREAKKQEDARRRAEEKLAEKTELAFWNRTKNDRYHLNLHRGGAGNKPLWSIAFKEKWERDRFWDWLGQLKDRLEAIAAEAQRVEWADLERRLLKEMLTTEQLVKKQGLGSGGRRPLRFWRGEL